MSQVPVPNTVHVSPLMADSTSQPGRQMLSVSVSGL